ncbi:Cation-transporting P-type ATPase [Cynara cardunculus var. scolymus]|uniref:P-type Cu(+) transporter n=1 Tax=Cynara cardunculus var. scolymus TaxID=59895 RepID=A0A103Y0C1_CYNCS|nr:Cation-transporting P-type ATPase [Cynara cardunculus var. scolymus]
MDVNGKDDLKIPLLQPSDAVVLDIKSVRSVDQGVRTIMFKIGGIECASCSTSIESVLQDLRGVESAEVSPLQGQAVVKYVPELVGVKAIKETVEDAGFEVTEFTEQDIAVCRLRIKGMACTSCSESVERALLMVEGVKKAVVGLALEEAKINYDPNVINTDRIIEAVEDAGFGADLIGSGNDGNKVHIKIEGITSPEDMTAVKCSLESLAGVNHVEIDMEECKVAVSYDPDLTGPRSLIFFIQEAGAGSTHYQASLYIPERRHKIEKDHEIKTYRSQFLWSCLFSLPLLLFSMVLPMIPPYGNWLSYKLYNMLTVGMLLRWILCTPVQFIIGKRFYVGSYHALRRKSANMDVLVALGTNAAYFYSVYTVIKASVSDGFEGQDFFETSTMLISFILLGKYLESIAKGKTSDALAKLTDLAPDTACLLTMGDDKNVIGGTVNENGCLLIKATHIGSETALSQIVQIVEAAQLARAPVQKLADRISRFFVPAVVAAAVVTWLAWFIPGAAGLYPKSWIPEAMDEFELALQFGISVLVVACPCALGLATPTAVMVSTGKGATEGVLIKGGNALEKAHKVNTIVFDKTGTLTVGKPEVVSVVLLSEIPMEEFCYMVIAVEANSEHPIAKAVVEHSKNRLPDHKSQIGNGSAVKDFEVHPGAGVGCKVGDRTVLVGNKKLMRLSNVPVDTEVENYFSDNEKLARTCVLVAIDGKVAGAFAVTDPVKPEAAQVISFLRSMSINSIMVTGDNWSTATAIAKEVGIENVFAEIDPLGKADRIKDLQARGKIVAMVGDGINDSPALVAANVGMAIGAGTDVAIEAADIVLIKSNLEDVITAIDLSRKTISRVHLNYVWALGYNILGMPIAAGALFPFTGIRLPPWLAGALMAASSISVVCSSLLLQTYKKPFTYSK